MTTSLTPERYTCLDCKQPVKLVDGYWRCNCTQVSQDWLELDPDGLPVRWYWSGDTRPRCGEPGCNTRAIECRITVYRSDVKSLGYFWHLLGTEGLRAVWGLLRDGWMDTHDYYCYQHASENGYCHICGEFCAGIDSFDFGIPPGLCDNCRDELMEADLDEEEEFYEPPDWEDDLP